MSQNDKNEKSKIPDLKQEKEEESKVNKKGENYGKKKQDLKKEKEEGNKINKMREDYGRKKLLSKIKKISKLSKSYSNLKSDDLLEKVITTKNENYYINSNTKLVEDIDYKKKLKEAKEVKDLENIFKKWNEDKVIFNLYHDLNKSYEFFDKQNLKENKKESSKEKNKKKKLEERKKMLKKIREIQLEKKKEKEMQTSEIDPKKIEKKMKKILEMINRKQDFIYDNKNNNFVKKLELILMIREFIKEEIILDNNNKNNLVTPEDAINYKDNDIIPFLGFLGKEISLQNNEIYIEEEPTYEFLRDITLKIITSNLANHNFYVINIKSDNLKKKFQENFENWLSYLNNIKLRISVACNVSQSNIYFFGHNFSTFEVNLILYKQKVEFLEKLLNNFDIIITESTLLNNIILSPNIFDSDFNKKETDWPTENLLRGGMQYYPPFGWIGMALKIKQRYDKDDIWLGKENKKGEWPVAYHGIGKNNNAINELLSILNESFKDFSEISKKNKEAGKKIHLFMKINDAEKQAEKIRFGDSNLKIQFVFMTRVNPAKLKDFDSFPSNFKLNRTYEEVRPYRLLYKIS